MSLTRPKRQLNFKNNLIPNMEFIDNKMFNRKTYIFNGETCIFNKVLNVKCYRKTK
jgi:hypothetical protein